MKSSQGFQSELHAQESGREVFLTNSFKNLSDRFWLSRLTLLGPVTLQAIIVQRGIFIHLGDTNLLKLIFV